MTCTSGQRYSYVENAEEETVSLHELSLISEMMDLVLSDAKSKGIRKITRVELRVGEFSGAYPHALREAFAVVSRGTPMEEAELVIEEVPAEFRCRNCGTALRPRESGWACPSCGSQDVSLEGGFELEVRSYHGRDRDVC